VGAEQQTFTFASDERLVELIHSARARLVVIAPAMSKAVAAAIAGRCAEENLSVAVVLDADPEVYRLGFGDQASLEVLRQATVANGLHLAMQAGLRIGMIAADEHLLVFSPVPALVEAGSKVEEKPNAIMLSGAPAVQIASAAGVGPDPEPRREIGHQSISPQEVRQIEADLAANPPQRFDIARAIRVFSSKIQYVEFEVENVRPSARRVRLPADLAGVEDQRLKERISSQIRPPEACFGPFEVEVENPEGEKITLQVGEKWLADERKRIEDKYTFVVKRHGRVILKSDRSAFDAEVARYQRNLGSYRTKVLTELTAARGEFEDTLVAEFLPRWERRPPQRFARCDWPTTRVNLELELKRDLARVIDEALHYGEARVRLVYKDVAYESVGDPGFRDAISEAMRGRVPTDFIDKLFSESDAAPAAKSLEPAAFDEDVPF
jgi:hypothetical protein